MDDHKRDFSEELDYRIALRRFESAFEACQRLPDEDRESLLRDIARKILQQVPSDLPREQRAIQVLGVQIKDS